MSDLRLNKREKMQRFLADNIVPVLFVIICAVGIPLSGYSPNYLINEVITRIGRN